ncbi:SRPBCC family protein [Rhodococcus kronopolitis]|uniref:SRPBCC family protein n=1 Tax=Rhodococcus kronopolitis TaxID=1460226 RepID=A0ABV9FN06_9NOCA
MIAMPVIEQSVVINRPAAEVWDYLTVAENWPSWDSATTDCAQVTDGQLGVGSRWRGVNRTLGRRVNWTAEFTDYDPPNSTAAKSVDSDVGFTTATRLEEVDGGTRFTYRIDTETGLGGVFGKLADPFVAKAATRTMRSSLDNLADLLTEGS